LTLYPRILGAAYPNLPSAVQRFHVLQGLQVLHGEVQTEAPASFLARCLAICLGAPRERSQGPLRFELDAGPMEETWTRHFPTRTMRSTLRWAEGEIEERLGASRLRFALEATPEGLRMQLQRVHCFGLPCPRWLQPSVVAEERGEGERLHFCIRATVPFVGQVASYCGYLDLPREIAP
jgi:Domain of unknown function (DUF4166)